MRTMWFLRGGLVLAFVLASCAPAGTDTVADSADKSATATPRPTDTPMPASTKSATNTPLPTQTDVQPTAPPTNTLIASPTNTATPLPPTPRREVDSAAIEVTVYDLEILGGPRFVNIDWIELDKISKISRFRSSIGHDFSHLDVYEEWSCRSMKHYYFMRSPDNLTSVFSPVDAEVIELIAAGKGNAREIGQSVGLQDVQIRMRVTEPEYAAFVVILFHIDLEVLLKVGEKISAGQLLGKKTDQVTGMDIAIYANTPQGKRLVSYFDVLSDDVFQGYANMGITSREMMIITREQREADPLSCTDVYFDHDGTIPGLVEIGDSETVSLSSGSSGVPQIEEIYCTERVGVGKKVECAFRYSGGVDRVAWGAPGGISEGGEEYQFTTQFDKPGNYVITLEVCSKRGCSTEKHSVEVVES